MNLSLTYKKFNVWIKLFLHLLYLQIHHNSKSDGECDSQKQDVQFYPI